MDELRNGGEPYMTTREMVAEIRADLKALDAKIDEIDRRGSIGTREELTDHESRLRRVERWVYGIPLAALLAVGGVIAALLNPS